MNTNVKNWSLPIVAYLLLLGCSKASELPVMQTADYIIEGNIYSAETLEPVENIKVEMYEVTQNASDVERDLFFSSQQGYYRLKHHSSNPYYSSTYKLVFKDTDGEENVLYRDTTINIVMNNEEFLNGSGEYLGECVRRIDVYLVQ
ncbi:MAG: radical SAM-associated putative lipoprotein [Prevotellaceae bacterium]|jgi:putative lipoprotein (rSAM/lipoprotein system)|nr:radical SAM-associated putative lipoprotein [Prevotellaceae bacterium]